MCQSKGKFGPGIYSWHDKFQNRVQNEEMGMSFL